MHYHIKASSDPDNTILAGTLYDSTDQVVNRIFYPGTSLRQTHGQEKFTLIVDDGESHLGKWVDIVCNFVTNAGTVFIASEKTCELFQKLQLNNLEYYDLTIQSKRKTLTNYKIINIASKIDCIDNDASNIVHRNNGYIKSINTLVFDEEKIPEGIRLFLLGRYATAHMFVHESVKEAIAKHLEGFIFTALQAVQGKLR